MTGYLIDPPGRHWPDADETDAPPDAPTYQVNTVPLPASGGDHFDGEGDDKCLS